MRRNQTEGRVPSLYIDNNKWGYQININHPKIKPYYDRFKKWKGIHLIPSDAERLEFEAYMLDFIERHKDQFY